MTTDQLTTCLRCGQDKEVSTITGLCEDCENEQSETDISNLELLTDEEYIDSTISQDAERELTILKQFGY